MPYGYAGYPPQTGERTGGQPYGQMYQPTYMPMDPQTYQQMYGTAGAYPQNMMYTPQMGMYMPPVAGETGTTGTTTGTTGTGSAVNKAQELQALKKRMESANKGGSGDYEQKKDK